ncbi:MAG: hypothetical protein ACRDPK_05555, partial [Carbonactinosporaceae bacterium]
DQVYVAPEARDVLPSGEADQIRRAVGDARTPIYIAVLPASAVESAGGDASKLPFELFERTGKRGTYAVVAGDRLRAGSAVIQGDRAGAIAAEATGSNPSSVRAGLLQFVADVDTEVSTGSAARSDSGGGGVPVLPILLVLAAGGAFLYVRKGRRDRARQAREQLEEVRPAVDEDITAYGEKLDGIGFQPGAAGVDDAMREDYQKALDAYDTAKHAMTAAHGPTDVRKVTEALEDGRYALACLEARQAGEPLPERRPPCFFDPRHGPSVENVTWTLPGDRPREVPACAADAIRVREGDDPLVRHVGREHRPYWDAGPAYGPWATGYFAGYGAWLLPSLFMGTMLGSMWADPVGADAWGADAGDFGGGGGDFGGGGGDFGGGDFGGGGGDFGGGF